MKKTNVMLVSLLLIGIALLIGASSLSEKKIPSKNEETNNAVMVKLVSNNWTCNPPILLFDGNANPSPLCKNSNYNVTISGTDNATITSITGGTLSGKNGDDYPCNWTIKPTTTSGLIIQVHGQCWNGSTLETSTTATYTYTVQNTPCI